MLKLSKRIEYTLLALQYMAAFKEEMQPAKKIAMDLGISFEFLSKALQAVMKKGLIVSLQGKKGGYYLAKDPEEISVMDIILALDESPEIVDCAAGEFDNFDNCERAGFCTLRNPMAQIQAKINKIFEETTIAELAKEYYNPILNGNRIEDIQILEYR